MLNFKNEYFTLEKGRLKYPTQFKDKSFLVVYGSKEGGVTGTELTAHIYKIPENYYEINAGQLDFSNYPNGIENDFLTIRVTNLDSLFSLPLNFTDWKDISPENLTTTFEKIGVSILDIQKRLSEVAVYIDSGKPDQINLPKLPVGCTWYKDQDENIVALPISDLYGKFQQMINKLHKDIKDLLDIDYGKLNQGLIDKTSLLIKELIKETEKLLDILANHGNNIKPKQVSDIEFLKRVNAKLNEVYEVLGYYKFNDGATHKRVIANEDDGSGVQLNNGLWANIVHNGEVNVSWFGADNSLSHLENGRKLTMILKLPQVKKVNIDKSLNAINIIFSEDKEIDGMGNTITGDSNNPIILYKLQELHPKGIRNLIFKDCKVAIFSESNYNFVLVLNDIKFIDCKKAIEYKSPIGSGGGAMLAFSRFENIEFIKSEYCIYLDCSNKSSCYANYIQFNNIKAYHCQAFIYANNIKQMIEWNIKFLNMEASVTTIEKLKTDRYGVVILENCTSCVFNIYNSYIEYVGSLITVGEATANQFKQGATLIEGTKNTYQKDGLYLDDGSSGEKAIYNFNYGAFNTKDCSRIKFQITDTSLTLTPAIIKSNGNDKEISFIASRNNVLTVLYEYPLKHGEFLTNRTDVEFGSSKGIFYIELSKGTVNNLGGMIYDSSIKWSYDKPPFIYKTGSIERNMNIYKFKEEIDLSQMTSSGEFSYAVSNVRHLCFLKNIFDAPLDMLDGGLVSGNVNLINGQFNLQTNGSKKYFILAQTGNICFNDTNFIFKGNENIEFIIGQNNVFTFENCTFDFSNFTGTVKFTGVMICMFRNIKIIGEKKVYFGNGVTALNNPFTANLSQLGTTYMATKMQQEGVYNDYISYMDEKTAYDKQQEKLEKQRQLAYEQALKENPNLTYEEFMSVQPMTLNLVEEPQPSQALQEFMEKYL